MLRELGKCYVTLNISWVDPATPETESVSQKLIVHVSLT